MVNKENPLLYFADVCAGPGGFSEYVLWRKKWKSKGFGFTLRGPCDFKLEDFFAGPRKFIHITVNSELFF
jgi:cap1 methyltransferase